MGLKEELLALADRPAEEVVVPEWEGRTLRIMVMTAADRDSWEMESYLERKAGGVPKNVRARLVARCLVADNGERVFSDADIGALSGKNSKAVDRLYDVALRLNALSEAEKKAVEGNSGGATPAA